MPAEACRLAPMRSALSRFASDAGLPADDACDFLLATYEAMVNVVEHAYPAGEVGTFDLWAAHDAWRGTIVVTVTDRGRWRLDEADPSLHRGRGITLMRSCSDAMEINPGVDGTGTQVTLEWTRDCARPAPDDEQCG
ncbi:ATP-binding protein [Rhodococcus sp. D2-41]|uniref:ATP-binding protein n=1 Tax=Speluncibacter jeojiensis TaxID=2710754 RepID=UPI0024106083|nr:ATP-binding protein [Rhodococcus sp. D2-41]MDG3010859.1 ATP-binding protein [Rhodococcus sp. D2-41]